MFTPVSSQLAQAFVPAHTAYPHLRNTGGQSRGTGRQIYPQSGPPPVLYGAHGQPLPIGQIQDPNAQPPAGYYQQPYPGPAYDDRGPPPSNTHPQDQVSRKRPRLDDPHTPVLVPVYSNNSPSSPSGQQRSGRRGSGNGFEYPDPTNLAPVSPATSASSYQSHPPSHPNQYYAPASQPRRSSPQSSYSYDNRASDSPHGSVSSSSGAYSFPNLHPPQVLPPTRDSGRTPPPPGQGGRSGMSVQAMLGPGENQGGRTNADSEMLNALNRKM
jgi:hypothetical protein